MRRRNSRMAGGAIFVTVLLAGLTAACSSSNSSTSANTTGSSDAHFALRLGDDQAAGIPGSLAEHRFTQEVTALTHGHVTFTIYPNNALGSEASQLTQIETGSLDSGVINMASISSQLPQLGLFGLPYLIPTTADISKLLNSSITTSVLGSLQANHLVGLSIVDDGPYAIIGNQPVAAASALKGLKERTQTDPTSVSFFTRLGVNVVALPFPQVYSALQQHVVDGAVAGPASMQKVSLYQVAKYLSPINLQSALDLIFFSQKTWDRLPAAYQTDIRQAAKQAQAWNLSVIDADTQAAVKQLQGEGVKLVTVNLSSFSADAQATADQYEPKIGASYVKQAEALLGTS
jgi:TRAP-type C4-dicarboxylate transport system substrate-binding protein